MKATLFKDTCSKELLSGLYLDILYLQSKIPSKKLIPNSNFNITLSSHRLADIGRRTNDRFALLSDKELLSILVLMKNTSPRTIMEFGLMRGGSLYHYYINTDAEVELHSIDVTDMNILQEVKETLSNSDRVHIHLSDSLNFNHKTFIGKIDFIFIDGGHDYRYVKNDSEKSFEMLSQNGVIIWDDYHPHFPGVFKYLNELFEKDKRLRHISGTSLVYLER